MDLTGAGVTLGEAPWLSEAVGAAVDDGDAWAAMEADTHGAMEGYWLRSYSYMSMGKEGARSTVLEFHALVVCRHAMDVVLDP